MCILQDENELRELLRQKRVERNLFKTYICDGICSKSLYEKYEWGNRGIETNKRNRLLARVGIDKKPYETYLEYIDFKNAADRNEIIEAIEHHRIKKATELLAVYESDNNNKNQLDRQFIAFMKAQILQFKNKRSVETELLKIYREAALYTIPNVDKRGLNKLVLSVEEINIYFEYKRRAWSNNRPGVIFNHYKTLITYIRDSYSVSDRVKILPKVVVNMYDYIKKNQHIIGNDRMKKISTEIVVLCQECIEIMVQARKSYYFVELYEAYIDVINYIIGEENHIEKESQLKEKLFEAIHILEAYKCMCTENNVSYKTDNDCYLYKQYDLYCLNMIVKERRKMLGLKLEDFEKGCCDEKTIGRFERKERGLQRNTLNKVLIFLGLYNDSDILKNERLEQILRKTDSIFLSEEELEGVYCIVIECVNAERVNSACKLCESLINYIKRQEKTGVVYNCIDLYIRISYLYAGILKKLGKYQESDAIVDKLIKLMLEERTTEYLDITKKSITVD